MENPFVKKSVGLDIADHTIEVAGLSVSFFSSKPIVSGLGRLSLEPGIVEHGRILSKKRLQESLLEVFESALPNPLTPVSVVLGLPERQVYTSIITIPCDRKNIYEQALSAAQETIPLEKDDLSLSYSVLSQSDRGCEVLLYAASKEVLLEWSDFCSESGIRFTTFDHELLAIIRGLFGFTASNPLCIIDLGAERCKIGVYSKKGLQYVYAVERAGDYFTVELSKLLGVPMSDAEKVKREEGMKNEKARVLFEKMLEPILLEIRTALAYYKNSQNAEIKEVILVGGSSQLPGLKEYFANTLKVPVSHGAPFLLPAPLDANDLSRLHYIEALGLALRGLDKKWERINPSLKL